MTTASPRAVFDLALLIAQRTFAADPNENFEYANDASWIACAAPTKSPGAVCRAIDTCVPAALRLLIADGATSEGLDHVRHLGVVKEAIKLLDANNVME